MKTLLWEIRDNANMSLQGLSNKTGISKTRLWRIENGEISPSLKDITRICDALQVDLWEVITRGEITA